MKYPFIIAVFFTFSARAEYIFSTSCGGVLDNGIGGGISYKVHEQYNEWENCIWTVRTENTFNVVVRMLQDGFVEAPGKGRPLVHIYDIGGFGPNYESIEQVHVIRAGNHGNHSVIGPVFFIQFTSGEAEVGTGFTLIYEAINGSTSQHYNLNHFDAPAGSFHYPDKPIPPDTNSIVSTTVLTPAPNKAIQLKLLPPTIVMQTSGSSRYCDAPILGVYEFGTTTPNQRLGFCRSDRTQDYTIVSPQPILLRFVAAHGYGGLDGDNEYNIEWTSVDFNCTSYFC